MRFAALSMLRGLAAAAMLLPGLAWAAEEASSGMPQLNFANPLTTSQVVWLAIIFFALYLLVSRWALPQVTEVVEGRAQSIAGDLDAARHAKAEADAASDEVNRAVHRAHAEAQAEIAGAIGRAKEASAAQAEQLNARLEGQLAEAERRIGEARQAAMGALREVATETAYAVVSRLTGRPADRPALDRAVGAVLQARRA